MENTKLLWNFEICYVILMKFCWYFDEIIPVTPFSVQISNTDELWSKYNNIVKCTNIFFKFFIQYFVHALYELMKYNMVNSIPNSTSGIRKQIFKLKDFHQGRGERICLNFFLLLFQAAGIPQPIITYLSSSLTIKIKCEKDLVSLRSMISPFSIFFRSLSVCGWGWDSDIFSDCAL